MSIILGALGGAADQVLKGMDDDRDASNKERLLRLSSQLETDKAKTLALFAEAQKAAPLNRLQGRAQALAGEQVPVEAAPATTLSGTYASEAGPSQGGFSGDIGIVQRAISQLPEGDDKAAALAQLRQQQAQANAAGAVAVKGQTRNRTSDEALDAALNEAKTNDLQAYAAGRGLATEKTVTVPEGSTVIDRSGKVIYSSGDTKAEREREREDRRDARASAAEDARDARQQRSLDMQQRLAEIRAGKDDAKVTKEERLRYTALFSDSGRQINNVRKTINALRQNVAYSMAKPGTPQYTELSELRDELKEYEQQREMYREILSSSGAVVPKGREDSAPSNDAPSNATRPPLSTFMK